MPFIALGVAMIIVDATIVNVAIPSIGLARRYRFGGISAPMIQKIGSTMPIRNITQ